MYTVGLNTGDIILFQEEPKCGSIFKLVDWAIRCWTHSPYSHVGLVVVDPPRVDVTTGQVAQRADGSPDILEGTFVWDSSKHVHRDPMDGKIKFGIALVPIDKYVHDNALDHQTLYKRSPVDPETYALFTPQKMHDLYVKVYGKPYDTQLKHWLAGMFHVLIARSDNTFNCSAFVSYALTYVGVLDAETNYTIQSPANLSSRAHNALHWLHAYGPDTEFSEF